MNLHEPNESSFTERELKAIRSQFDDFQSKIYQVVALDKENDEISISPQKFMTPYIAQRFIKKMQKKYPGKRFIIVTQEISYRLDAIVPPHEIEEYVNSGE